MEYRSSNICKPKMNYNGKNNSEIQCSISIQYPLLFKDFTGVQQILETKKKL